MSTIVKPLLAKDVDESKLKFPCWVLPKIDGVCLLVHEGKAQGRSLKQFENKHVTQQYSNEMFNGLRGEIILGFDPTAEGLCRDTSSAIRRIEGEPETSLWVFDYVTEETKDLPFKGRYALLKAKVIELRELGCLNIKFIQAKEVKDLYEYKKYVQESLEHGLEGVVVRNPDLPHKEGRSSSTKAHLWRYKPYKDAEILVTGITEGETNLNEATINELGRTTRSTHQENKLPNAMVGSIQGTLLEDLTDVQGKVIKAKGAEVTVSPGEMTASERKYFFANQSEIVGQIAKFRYMAYGLKDTGRFMTYICLRSAVDMS
jgi:DNA ligase-1